MRKVHVVIDSANVFSRFVPRPITSRRELRIV
jgi:hypothetical protein